MPHIIILCPLYRDEVSFNIFAGQVEEVVNSLTGSTFSFLIVNDGADRLEIQAKLSTTIVNLHRNIGHQKAIAIGLAYAREHLQFDHILIMDGDGEDRPGDIPRLVEAAMDTGGVVVAQRVNRQEPGSFRFFYSIYKKLFYLLTGKRISFGNFMLVPAREVDSLAYFSETWSHLAGALIKSRIRFTEIKTNRGKRYAGNSKMNFNSLLLHGLGAIGVFIEIIASRLLMFSLFLILLSVIAILVILFIKIFTAKAIPGWATAALSSMLIVLLQSFLLSLFTIFLYLSSQGQRKFIPALHYQDYVRSIETGNHD